MGAHGAMLAHAAGAMGSWHGARPGAVSCDDAEPEGAAWCFDATGMPLIGMDARADGMHAYPLPANDALASTTLSTSAASREMRRTSRMPSRKQERAGGATGVSLTRMGAKTMGGGLSGTRTADRLAHEHLVE